MAPTVFLIVLIITRSYWKIVAQKPLGFIAHIPIGLQLNLGLHVTHKMLKVTVLLKRVGL